MATSRKFTPGFRYYQKTGGQEHWELLRADLAKWDEIKPTFMSVLRIDKAFKTDSTAEQWKEARYAGPMYFDFDDADDPVVAVKGAIKLLTLLANDDVPPEGCTVSLSGSKGVHVTVPVGYFVGEGPFDGGSEPFEYNLPLIYKEVAWKYATPCMDFRVYSQRSGRMWRTHYNQRENGLYKVEVTFQELCGISSRDDYIALCSMYRDVAPADSKPQPSLSGRMGTIYAEAYEAVNAKMKERAKTSSKPLYPTLTQARVDKEGFELVAAGAVSKDDKGWNHIALQLSLYAQHYKWSVDDLIEKIDPLIQNHPSDSYRYNSAKKRINELKRMYDYVAENPTYEYKYGGLNHLLEHPPVVAEGEEDGQTFDPGLIITSTSICTQTENGVKAIANFGLTNCRSLMSVEDQGEVYAAAFDLSTRHNAIPIDINPQDFTGSARLQSELSKVGAVFVGGDAQARGLLHIVSTASQAKSYVIDKAGLNVIKFTLTNATNAPNLYPVWMDDNMIVTSAAAENLGLRFEHRPNMTAVHTDLSKAHQWSNLLASTGGKEKVAKFFKNLFRSKRPAIMGRLLGWYVAAFYKQLFQQHVGSFPLLHIYGIAGAGKTETQRLLMRMFSVDEAPTELSPGTSLFAFVRLLSSSASIPVLLDEWKPSEYKEAVVGDYRGIMREAYNQKPWVRAGAQGRRDSWSGLTKFYLSAPLVYVGEAAESQTAIVERSVMVGFTRASDQEQAATYRAFLECVNDHDTLPALGRFIAAQIVAGDEMGRFQKVFSKIRDRALERNTLSVADLEAYRAGTMTEEEYQHKATTKIRTMLGACTVEFGLRRLQNILQNADLGADIVDLKTYFEEAYEGLYNHDGAADLAVPEYIKVLTTLADLAKATDGGANTLELNKDYHMKPVGDRQRLVLTLKPCWLKYVRQLRELGLRPMFPEAMAFLSAMRNTHHFEAAGKDPQTSLEFLELDYASLLRSGCGEFPVKKHR